MSTVQTTKRLSKDVEEFLKVLGGRSLDEFIEDLQQEALEELASRLHRQAERENVEVYLTGQMKSLRVESVCTNGPILQINIDETQEPTTVVTMAKPEANALG